MQDVVGSDCNVSNEDILKVAEELVIMAQHLSVITGGGIASSSDDESSDDEDTD